MDPVKQAQAICNHGVSVTALQQQLVEMKSKTSGLESFIRSGLQSEASPCFPEAASAKQPSPSTTGEWTACHSRALHDHALLSMLLQPCLLQLTTHAQPAVKHHFLLDEIAAPLAYVAIYTNNHHILG